MVAKLHCAAVTGIQAAGTEVEVDDARRAFAGATVVGLPDAAANESTERVRIAMQNPGYQFPRNKTVTDPVP